MNPNVTESAVSDFIGAARIACLTIEQFDGKDRLAPLAVLTALLHAAEVLRNFRIEADDSDLLIEHQAPALEQLPEDIFFYVVFDPLDPNSVVAATLKDGLRDIYASLKGGLRVLEQFPEKRLDVLWEWRNDYEFHWGRHLIDAIRFLMLS